MKCPKCGVEMRVGEPHVEVSGDTSAAESTVVVQVQPLICRNKNCLLYGNAVSENRIVLYEGAAAEDEQNEAADDNDILS